MSYKNVHRNLTDTARAKGRKKASAVRQAQYKQRHTEIVEMLNQRLSKAEIARRTGLSWETINRHSKKV